MADAQNSSPPLRMDSSGKVTSAVWGLTKSLRSSGGAQRSRAANLNRSRKTLICRERLPHAPWGCIFPRIRTRILRNYLLPRTGIHLQHDQQHLSRRSLQHQPGGDREEFAWFAPSSASNVFVAIDQAASTSSSLLRGSNPAVERHEERETSTESIVRHRSRHDTTRLGPAQQVATRTCTV